MLVIPSRGGDSSLKEAKGADFQEPYLRFAFGFVGITDITFINAEPMGMGEELQRKAITASQEKAKSWLPEKET
jgi:FMN-dependent NADH-azoreductase